MRIVVGLAVRRVAVQLRTLIGERIAFWRELEHRSDPIDAKIAELQAKLAKMNWTDSVLPGYGPGSVQRSIAQLKDAQNEILKSERDIVAQFQSVIESARSTREALDAAQPAVSGTSPTLVYWHDGAGEHAFVTDEKLELIATDHSSSWLRSARARGGGGEMQVVCR